MRSIDARDVLGLVGFVALEVGVGLWSIPGALVVCGILCLAVALWPDLRRRTP
jgi:hypothetical protein